LKESEEDPDPFDGYHVMYSHPTNGGPAFPTLSAELQLLPPKFRTKSHRHNSKGSYFVLRGEGATLVNGERLEWSQGDILAIPGWAWHQHENRLDQDAVLYYVTDQPTMAAWGFYREEAAES
jgi:gentisate 1,2-dioxygenase